MQTMSLFVFIYCSFWMQVKLLTYELILINVGFVLLQKEIKNMFNKLIDENEKTYTVTQPILV